MFERNIFPKWHQVRFTVVGRSGPTDAEHAVEIFVLFILNQPNQNIALVFQGMLFETGFNVV